MAGVFAALVASILVCQPAPGQASFIGDTVTVSTEDFIANPLTQNVTVVDPGAEISGGDNSAIGGDGAFGTGVLFSGESIDIGATSITFTFTGFIQSFFEVTGLDWIGTPSTITGVSSSLLTGALNSPLTLNFTADSVRVDLDVADAGASFRVDLTVTPDNNNGGGQVPEPGSLALFAVGLFMLGYLARRASLTR